MKIIFFIFLLFLGCDYQEDGKFIGQVITQSSISPEDQMGTLEENLESWFKRFVIEVTPEDHPFFDTRVDYQKMIDLYQKQDSNFLNLRRSILSHFNFTNIQKLTKLEKLSFYINAYNFFMMNTVLVKSKTKLIQGPLKIPLVGDKNIFDQKIVDFDNEKIIIAEQSELTLNNIEHDIIRKEILNEQDGRIHFALNCAALGCPAILPKPFTADSIDQELNKATKNGLLVFRNIHNEDNVTSVTKLFEWFAIDFINETGESDRNNAIRQYIKKYLPDAVIKDEISIHNYNWCLNQFNKNLSGDAYQKINTEDSSCN